MRVPGYVEERIRRAPPARCCVLTGSTPVVAFGDALRARVATLGLNPSKQEFLSVRGRELDGPDRRFETLGSLGVGCLARASRGRVERVLAACNEYFQRNPYRWFDPLEEVLNAVGASYFKGTACHLDLVQWATDPVWSGISWRAWWKLLESDLPFLKRQLLGSRIRLLLLNGRSVIREFEQAFETPLQHLRPDIRERSVTTRIYSGRVLQGIQVLGWNTNLQSSFGVTLALRRKLSRRLAGLAR